MWIEPKGFSEIHSRGNTEAHRLQDPSKWVPFGVGAIEGQASSALPVLESGEAAPWSKPEDLPYVPGKPVPKVGGAEGGPFWAAFCDGSVRRFKAAPRDAVFHAYITRNGGEVIPANDD